MHNPLLCIKYVKFSSIAFQNTQFPNEVSQHFIILSSSSSSLININHSFANSFVLNELELPDTIVLAAHKFWGDRRYTHYDFVRSLGKIPQFNNMKIQLELGLQITPISESFADTAESLREFDIIPPTYSKSILSKL